MNNVLRLLIVFCVATFAVQVLSASASASASASELSSRKIKHFRKWQYDGNELLIKEIKHKAYVFFNGRKVFSHRLENHEVIDSWFSYDGFQFIFLQAYDGMVWTDDFLLVKNDGSLRYLKNFAFNINVPNTVIAKNGTIEFTMHSYWHEHVRKVVYDMRRNKFHFYHWVITHKRYVVNKVSRYRELFLVHGKVVWLNSKAERKLHCSFYGGGFDLIFNREHRISATQSLAQQIFANSRALTKCVGIFKKINKRKIEIGKDKAYYVTYDFPQVGVGIGKIKNYRGYNYPKNNIGSIVLK